MAMMLGALYHALISANVNEDEARKAAEEVAGFENRLNKIEADLLVLKWMGGVVITMLVFVLGKLYK